jgi:hypothetical protein
VLNPIEMRGCPLVVKVCLDLEVKTVNEQGLVVETSAHSINRRDGGFGHGDKTVSPRYHDGWFFLQAYYVMSLHLTEDTCTVWQKDA